MSDSGEHGPQPAPGLPAAAATNRRDEETDASPCERGEEVEVILLSPRTLMSPIRCACEVCGKGFQREQNLQLHRRGHGYGARRSTRKQRAYVCPEESCPRHDPAGALGNLKGIKMHYRRRHGDDGVRKRECEWDDHAATDCVGEDYGCECGAVFPRQDRESFVTHRSVCDVLARWYAAMPAITFRPQDDDQVNASGGAFGFGIGSNDLMNRLWGRTTVLGADNVSSSGDGGAVGLGIGSNHLMNHRWGTTVLGADNSGSSGGDFGFGFTHRPFELDDDARRGGCVPGACTRPEVPPLDSLSRPFLAAAARAHAFAYEHVCESCREFLKAEAGKER
ncbi:unnamed protein product [Urochloa humidicola]